MADRKPTDSEAFGRVVGVMFGVAFGAVPLAVALAASAVVFMSIARCGKAF